MLKAKSRHRDAAPPVHCTELQQLLHAQHVTSPHSSKCAWLLIHMTGVHVAEFLTCPLLSWARRELQTHTLCSCNLIVILFFAIHVISVDSIAKQIINCLNEFNQLFLSPHFPQKRAKKLEGETIYIRHSNLMLEVCIFSLQISVLAVRCLVFLPASVTVYFLFALMLVSLNFSSCFQLNPKGMACTIYLSDSHASSVISLWHCLCHFIFNFCEIYHWGRSLFSV